MSTASRARTAGMIGIISAAITILKGIVEQSLGLGSDGSALGVIGEVVNLAMIIGINIGFLGLIWGGAFRGRLGTFAVAAHVLAYALIVLGGIAALILGEAAGPLFLLFPIGGALSGLASLLLIVAVLAEGRWDGWQRWIPLCYGVYQILAVGLPMLMGVTPDGPSFSVELGTSIWWLLVGLAVYTAQGSVVSQHSAVSAV